MKKFLVVGLAGLLSASAFADQGDILARFRVIDVSPTVSSSGVLSAVNASLNSNTVPELDFTYMITNNIGAELILGTSRHHLTSSLGDLGSVSVLPPTLTVQYHFNPQGTFRPYVGAGVNYTRFYHNGLNVGGVPVNISNNRFGLAVQAGMDYAISKDWFVNVDVKKIDLKTDATLSSNGASLGTLKINPWVYGVGIGTKF